MNFYCLKVGDRYTIEFVHKLESMISRTYDSPYKLHCITDRPEELPIYIEAIEMPDLGVEKWWNKMILFNEDYVKEGVFFDLDIVMKGCINNIHQPGQYMRFMHTDWVDLDKLRKETIGNRQRFCSINSSVLSWDQNTQRHNIWEYFIENKEKIVNIFTGIDSFIEHRFPNNYSVFPEPLDQIHIFLDKKQDEMREESWIQKLWI